MLWLIHDSLVQTMMKMKHSEYVVRFTVGGFKFFLAEDIEHLKEIVARYHPQKELACIYSSVWSTEKDQWNQ